MKVYVQSKNGDHNVVLHGEVSAAATMERVIRKGYYVDDDGRYVPADQVRYMKEVTE